MRTAGWWSRHDELQTVISVMLSPADAKRFASRLKRQETAGLTKPRAAQ